jgi:ribosome biogenesis GTPase / thiamine phosphate phosphatase
VKGTIIKSTGSWYSVMLEDGTLMNCRLKGAFRLEGSKSTNPLAVGDHVEVEPDNDNESGMIHKLHDRKNYIIRKATKLSSRSHVIASNIDRAYLVVTLVLPRTSMGFIDRFLATAEAYRIPVTLLINKKDLYTSDDLKLVEMIINLYKNIGYEVELISALDEKDILDLRERMKGNVNLIAGHSGVGKSTLINAMEKGLNIKTKEISGAHDKGTHTTTNAEMYPLKDGGFIIDTPGIKEFGMINMEKEELSHYFPEIFAESSNCKFSTCLHLNEPGCAVMQAVEDGKIAESRYLSYLGILTGKDMEREY